MAWTYKPADLATSPRDQVRFRIGDTDPTDPQLQDEEIDFTLTLRDQDVNAACYDCVSVIISKLSYIVDYKLGPYTETSSKSLDNWRLLLTTFANSSIHCVAPVALMPETKPVFNYDMMSRDIAEDRIDECQS